MRPMVLLNWSVQILVLHEEMRLSGSLIMGMGDMTKLPAGGALAVDRDAFSDAVTTILQRPPAKRLGEFDYRNRPPHRALPRQCHPRGDGRR